MNGRQRAVRLADKITDLQRLQRQFKGKPEALPLGQAIAKLSEARQLALTALDDGHDDEIENNGS